MLGFYSFLIALITSLVFFGILYILIRWALKAQNRVNGFFLAYMWVTLFLPIWAGGLWLRIGGPELVEGISLLGYILVGLAVSMVIVAFLPKREPEEASANPTQRYRDEVAEQSQASKRGLRYGMWAFGVFMAGIIVLGLIFPPW
jgi:hypothetical protein